MRKLFTNIVPALAIGSMAFMVSCSESTDPLPISKADFKITSVGPEIDVPVQFENLSLNASAYVWDYGDGMKDSLVTAPMHTYDTPGTFTVKMTAYTEDGQKSEALKDIKVGERYLTSMRLVSINMLDPEGNPWDDDGSGPDVLFQLGPSDATSLDDLVFVIIDSLNVGQIHTPIALTISNGFIPQNYKLMNKDYDIFVEEVNTEDFEELGRQMAGITFNPVIPDEGEYLTYVKRKDPSGKITGDITIPFIVENDYQFFLEFEIR